ncbi:sulfite exporter TauE/SafE family protein [Tissierella praeacuta]|uniref:sulfite exporter TauE/SafE family protein n=1 Tax=Tissierella praeacuta TaxID=43131 RepID=UPI0033412D1F
MDKKKVKLLSIGLITGLINGLFGSGGGTIVVPALVFLLGVNDYKAHATAISIILPLSIISTIIYFANNSIPFKIALPVAIGGMVGSYIGAKTLNKIPINILRKIFGSVIIYTAIRMIWK